MATRVFLILALGISITVRIYLFVHKILSLSRGLTILFYFAGSVEEYNILMCPESEDGDKVRAGVIGRVDWRWGRDWTVLKYYRNGLLVTGGADVLWW